MSNLNENIPEQYKPISAWGYVGYQILFSIPLVGFILLIVFAVSDSNINRRNFARSYFCVLLLTILIVIITIVILMLTGVSLSFNLPNIMNQ
ncbi:MAG: ABC transporter permease [Clostridia bacterium]|nr:ABC transporter permease [Clostridia bacterium]